MLRIQSQLTVLKENKSFNTLTMRMCRLETSAGPRQSVGGSGGGSGSGGGRLTLIDEE